SWSADGSRLAAVRTYRGRCDLVVIDAESGSVDLLATGGVWSDPAWLADGTLAAVYEDHATPARIEAVALDGTRRPLFAPAPAAITSAPHVAPVDVVFHGRDGLEIHGFLFRPAAADEGPVPTVVYPHGGPTSLYADEWDGYAQYFLDKGYAWFAINFRGSTSYGRDFERANHGTWGVDDTQDCLAAADYLRTLDWVDGDRLAIFGASYGSYLALVSLTDDPSHRFACGVAKYGDCDILTSWAQGDRPGVEDLERMMGHPSRSRAAYRAGSPIHRLDQIERPLLVAHGENDKRVDPRQSEQLVKELDRLGKTYEYLTYPTEGHGLLRREPQLHFYRRLERFLDWYLM
ncbi:MAG TPA: prolyl oligopeptidase family serine peptidase, partial [Acidimicrobiia bacterium]|nr:prolyl oligopeptidase family serine peptidase [Acidimicrobiia bacterium]